MTSNVSVKITADVIDLQTKFAVARAETNALTAEMNKLARASASGVIDSGGQARLRQLAGDLLAARSQAGGYAMELEKAGFATGNLISATQRSHGSISTATREFRALFDELSSGRTRMTPGTLAIIAQRVLGLSGTTLAATGGVLALVGGLALLAVRATQASNAIDQMHLGALASGVDVSRSQFQQLVEQIALLPGISSTAARTIISSFSSVPGMTFESITAAARLTAEEVSRSGGNAEKSAASYARLLEASRSAVEVAKEIGGLTQAQVDEAIAADRSQNANAVLAEKLKLLETATARARPALDEYNRSWGEAIRNYLLYSVASEEGMTFDQMRTDILSDQTKAWRGNAEAIAAATAALASAPAKTPLVYDQGSALERMRDQITQLGATWDGTQSGMLAKEIAVARSFLAEAGKNSKEYLQIQQEMARLESEYRKAVGEELIASTRTSLAGISAETRVGTLQRLQIEVDSWQAALNAHKGTAAQREEIERNLNAALSAITRERASETEAIARSDAQTDLAISRLRVAAQKQAVEAETAEDARNYQQRFAMLRTLTEQEYELNLKALQSEQAGLQAQPVEYERVYNEIRQLTARKELDIATLNRQEAVEAERNARQQVTLWRSAISEIEGAESGFVADLIGKRRSLAQSLLQIGTELITKEIANDVKAITTRLLVQQQGEATKRALEQGGYLYHLLFESQKTGTTVAQSAARTSAVASGLATQQTAVTAAATAGKAVQAAYGPSQVMADAAVAAAGSFASVAAIPWVGWAMAPGVAEAAFAEVSAYAPLASLAEGAWNIPREGLYHLHAGEAVNPVPFAEGMRAATGGSGGGGLSTTNHFGGNTINVGDTSLRRLLQNRGNQRELMRAFSTAFRRGARM